MKSNALAVVFFIVIVLLVAGVVYLNNSVTVANSKNALLAKQKELLMSDLAKAKTRQDTLEADLSGLKSEREALASKISNLETRMRSMGEEHTAKVSEMSEEINTLKAQLTKVAASMQEKEATIQSLTAKIQENEKEMMRLRGQSSGNGIAGVENAVGLDPITVTSSVGTIKAEVSEVNSEYGFAVINAGLSEGVKAGDTLFVSRQGKTLGKVVVERLDNHYCVAKILYKSLSDEIQKKDQVSN